MQVSAKHVFAFTRTRCLRFLDGNRKNGCCEHYELVITSAQLAPTVVPSWRRGLSEFTHNSNHDNEKKKYYAIRLF